MASWTIDSSLVTLTDSSLSLASVACISASGSFRILTGPPFSFSSRVPLLIHREHELAVRALLLNCMFLSYIPNYLCASPHQIF